MSKIFLQYQVSENGSKILGKNWVGLECILTECHNTSSKTGWFLCDEFMLLEMLVCLLCMFIGSKVISFNVAKTVFMEHDQLVEKGGAWLRLVC